MSSVPCTSALVLSAGAIASSHLANLEKWMMGALALDCQEEGRAHPSGRASGPRVLVDDSADRAAADPAEADRIAREHDAIRLGAVQPLRFVTGAFKRADL